MLIGTIQAYSLKWSRSSVHVGMLVVLVVVVGDGSCTSLSHNGESERYECFRDLRDVTKLDFEIRAYGNFFTPMRKKRHMELNALINKIAHLLI